MKKRYRLFIQTHDGIWRYEKDIYTYFDSEEDALDHAAALNLKGIIEEWTTDIIDDQSNGIDVVDILCDSFAKFNFENGKGTSGIEWLYVYKDRKIYTPGYVFNYFKHYVDKYIVLSDIIEVVENKPTQVWAS